HLPFSLEHLLWVGEARQVARILSERLRVEAAVGEQTLLASLTQLAHGKGTELGPVRRQTGERRGRVKESLNLLAEALLVAEGQRIVAKGSLPRALKGSSNRCTAARCLPSQHRLDAGSA